MPALVGGWLQDNQIFHAPTYTLTAQKQRRWDRKKNTRVYSLSVVRAYWDVHPVTLETHAMGTPTRVNEAMWVLLQSHIKWSRPFFLGPNLLNSVWIHSFCLAKCIAERPTYQVTNDFGVWYCGCAKNYQHPIETSKIIWRKLEKAIAARATGCQTF